MNGLHFNELPQNKQLTITDGETHIFRWDSHPERKNNSK